ncbi:acyltransferase family protein [Alicyclobacillus sp. ALC3]|uniref:acyltransferase family protein n=1 Tax=Alicyclobacillus sp. ALC3 TaxID=2796143 RepID=UPI002378E866|nr:acyltransferase [Alicyclobacillus sp. ALC3]WDL95322.1 acyltransferase [Alicyclobacillus sp. ALC3]
MLESRPRLEELDSIRGIAALTVVFYHCATVVGGGALGVYLLRSPFAILIAGRSAVIMFFMLSGFVLSLPYHRATKVSYSRLMIKRIFRLYVPYLAAILTALLVRSLFKHPQVLSFWIQPITPKALWQDLLMIGQNNQMYLDPVTWSLTQEMRISILFPILMFIVLRFRWEKTLLIGFLLSCTGIVYHLIWQNSVDLYTNYFDTLHYIMMFMVGALIARNRSNLGRLFTHIATPTKVVVGIFGLICYSVHDYLSWKLQEYGYGTLGPFLLTDWVVVIGAAILIVTAITNKNVSRTLLFPPFKFLGKISYSLYLFHFIVILTLMKIFPHAPFYIIDPCVVSISILIGSIAHYLIESPSMKLGKLLTAKHYSTGKGSLELSVSIKLYGESERR